MLKSLVLRQCIACRKTYDRNYLFKITNDHKLGVMFGTGIGRSAYICKSRECFEDSKIKRKLQKALKTTLNQKFFDNFKGQIANYK